MSAAGTLSLDARSCRNAEAVWGAPDAAMLTKPANVVTVGLAVDGADVATEGTDVD